jgi:uncharacterized protein
MLIVGTMYEVGEGAEVNLAEGLKWITKAADKGNGRAQYSLGNMYEQGLGVDKDRSKAIELYKASAKNGDQSAKDRLKALGKE